MRKGMLNMARKVQRTNQSKGKRRTQQKPIRTSGFMNSNATQKTDLKTNIIRVIKRIKEFMDKNNGVLTILFAVTQICLVIFQIKSANIQQSINELYQPLEFSVNRGNVSGVYGNTGLDAYYTDMKITSGSVSQMYVLSYNEIEDRFMIAGEYFEPKHIRDLLPSVSTNPVYKDGPTSISQIYDYFFIYAIAANGTRYVNCYYYIINLQIQEVDGPFQVHEIELINFKNSVSPTSYSYEQMLHRYQMLMNKIDEIPYSSCGQITDNLQN